MKRHLGAEPDASFITLKYKRTHVESNNHSDTIEVFKSSESPNQPDEKRKSIGTSKLSLDVATSKVHSTSADSIGTPTKINPVDLSAETEIHRVLGPVQSTVQDLYHELLNKERQSSSNMLKISELESSEHNLKQALVTTEHELNDQTSLADYMKSVNHLKTTQLHAQDTTINDLRQQCHVLESQLAEATARINQLHNEVLTLQSNNAILTRRSDNLSTQLGEAQTELSATREHAQSLGEISKSLIEEKLMIAKQYNTTKNDSDITRTDLENKTKIVDQLQDHIRVLENRLDLKDDDDIAELKRMRNERNEFQRRMVLMEDEISDRDRKIYQLERQLQNQAQSSHSPREKARLDHHFKLNDGVEQDNNEQKQKLKLKPNQVDADRISNTQTGSDEIRPASLFFPWQNQSPAHR